MPKIATAKIEMCNIMQNAEAKMFLAKLITPQIVD